MTYYSLLLLILFSGTGHAMSVLKKFSNTLTTAYTVPTQLQGNRMVRIPRRSNRMYTGPIQIRSAQNNIRRIPLQTIQNWAPLLPPTIALLHRAAYAGDEKTLRELLYLFGYTSGLEIRNYSGFTPLHAAAAHGHTACVEMLLKHDGSIDALTDDGKTALELAAVNNHQECFNFLYKEGAALFVNRTCSLVLVLYALKQDNVHLIQNLIISIAYLHFDVKEGIVPQLQKYIKSILYGVKSAVPPVKSQVKKHLTIPRSGNLRELFYSLAYAYHAEELSINMRLVFDPESVENIYT